MKSKGVLFSKLAAAAFVLVILVAPSVLSRHVLYRANLGRVRLDEDGYAHLENVPMKIGESYTIYLSYLPGFCFPPFSESSTSQEGATKVEIYDDDLQRIPNQIKWYTRCCTLSESASKIGVYTAQEQGPQPLKLRFNERPKHPLNDFEVVIRRSSLSSPILLLLSDRSNIWLLVVMGIGWVYKRLRE